MADGDKNAMTFALLSLYVYLAASGSAPTNRSLGSSRSAELAGGNEQVLT